MVTKPERSGVKHLETRGWHQLEQGLLEKALGTFSRILELEPGNEAGYQGKAAALRKSRYIDQAFRTAEEGLKHYPQSVGLLSECAWLHISQKNYKEAIDIFDRILEISNSDPGHFLWKTYLLREQRRYKETMDTLWTAEKLFPGNIDISNEWGWLFFAKGMYQEALQAFDRTLLVDQVNHTALQGKIASLRKQGFFEEANEFIQRLPQEITEGVSFRNEQGWMYFEQKMYDEAVAEFQKVITLLPDDANVYLNLVWALVKRAKDGDLTQAASCCRQALSIEPSLAQAYGALGVIAFKQDRLFEAEAYLLHSIELDPEMGFFVDLGALYIMMGRFDEAEKYLKEAIVSHSQDAYLHNQLGYLFLETERVGEAIKEFRKAISLDPRQAEYYRSYAIALSENDGFVEAETTLRKALKQVAQPERWLLHLTLAQLLTRMANLTNDVLIYQRALEEANFAYSLQPHNSSVNFQNGIIRFKLNDQQGAFTFFQKCLKENKDHLEADLNIRRLKAIRRQERLNERVSRPERIFIGLFLVIQVIAIWYVYLVEQRISETLVLVLMPIYFGLLIVALMLPWLNRIKLTGLEADLSEPKPKETLDLGPKGDAFLNDRDFHSKSPL